MPDFDNIKHLEIRISNFLYRMFKQQFCALVHSQVFQEFTNVFFPVFKQFVGYGTLNFKLITLKETSKSSIFSN